MNKRPREIYEILDFSSKKYVQQYIFKEAFLNIDYAFRNILQSRVDSLSSN